MFEIKPQVFLAASGEFHCWDISASEMEEEILSMLSLAAASSLLWLIPSTLKLRVMHRNVRCNQVNISRTHSADRRVH